MSNQVKGTKEPIVAGDVEARNDTKSGVEQRGVVTQAGSQKRWSKKTIILVSSITALCVLVLIVGLAAGLGGGSNNDCDGVKVPSNDGDTRCAQQPRSPTRLLKVPKNRPQNPPKNLPDPNLPKNRPQNPPKNLPDPNLPKNRPQNPPKNLPDPNLPKNRPQNPPENLPDPNLPKNRPQNPPENLPDPNLPKNRPQNPPENPSRSELPAFHTNDANFVCMQVSGTNTVLDGMFRCTLQNVPFIPRQDYPPNALVSFCTDYDFNQFNGAVCPFCMIKIPDIYGNWYNCNQCIMGAQQVDAWDCTNLFVGHCAAFAAFAGGCFSNVPAGATVDSYHGIGGLESGFAILSDIQATDGRISQQIIANMGDSTYEYDYYTNEYDYYTTP